MTEQADIAPPATVNPRILGAVEVTLEALIGEARLTVAELNALKPGAVISLGSTLAHPVELRLGGAVVARGELVAVDDRFGVRLTELSTAGE